MTLGHNVPVLRFQRDSLPSLAGVKLISQKRLSVYQGTKADQAIVLRAVSRLLVHLHAESWPLLARL